MCFSLWVLLNLASTLVEVEMRCWNEDNSLELLYSVEFLDHFVRSSTIDNRPS